MKKELQNRMVRFSTGIILLERNLKPSIVGKNLFNQLSRSATSSALNYGEAQTAESKKDFIHKLGVVIKELKETEINLEIILEAELYTQAQPIYDSLNECNQLIAIFSASRKKAKENEGRI
jgi:four helix bundle protein